jgi:hypothetical protein
VTILSLVGSGHD